MQDEGARRLGVWIVGARGAVATCVAYGLAGLRRGLVEPIGLATARPPLDRLPLAPLEGLVLGGHDVVRRDVARSADELVRAGVLRPELVAAAAEDAAAYDARIRPGAGAGAGDAAGADVDPEAARLGRAPARERVERLRADLEAFRRAEELDRVVVVLLSSTEPWREERPEWGDPGGLDAALDAADDAELPASCLYAAAAAAAGMPLVNFTPNRGAAPAALRALFRERGVPHCGNDGKTGETLLKTALAPMFAARALRVLAWQGYNMLGNRDGEALSDPVRREAKRRNKDEALRAILGDRPELHTEVGIDYVPSLHDWKTAMDYVHFEGFLGARMSLQLTWTGSDSALAAPLVLDLVRLADLAAARGEEGEMEHVACYFKSPLTGGTHDFHEQYRRLVAYAERAAGGDPAR